jgi:hypothetical protein
VSIDGSVVTSVLPSHDKHQGDNESSEREEPLHWFFKVELANGEFYALDLCTAQFSPTPGAEAWACVVPLNEHLRRLPLSVRLPGFQGMAQPLGRQRQRLLNETPMQSSPEQVMAGVVELEDLDCEAQKFASAHLEDIISKWAVAQSTSPEKALHLPVARFMHTFCTIVWPIERMGEDLRVHMVLLMMGFLRRSARKATSRSGSNE